MCVCACVCGVKGEVVCGGVCVCETVVCGLVWTSGW